MPDPTATSESSTNDLTGRQIGDYRLLRRLGRGGMADVYLAEQISLRRNIALKILKPDLATDESYVKRFEREAQAAAALVQANIVQIYEVGCDQGFYYIAQEYVRGRNLKQYIDRHGAVEPVMAINVLRQSALALQKAGELGVVHRDIKPENIMLSTKGEVKITDFGLARLNNNPAEQALTQIGVTMGTPLYMSPEQVGGDSLDHRSDIYSLGVTAFHMLAGEPPFNGDNALAIAVQHVNNQPPPLSVLRPDVPAELIHVIEKMMSKKPANRHTDPKRLLKELRAVKVDVDEDWEMIVEKLSVAELTQSINASTSFSQAQLAATRQLQQVMKGNIRSWWRSTWFLVSTAVLGIAGLLGGVYWAQQTQPDSMLQVDDIEKERIPKEDSIERQYHMALLMPMDQHEVLLNKVIEYFPIEDASSDDLNRTQLYHRRTKSRLAEWYLMNSRWRDAEKIYSELSESEDLAEQFQVTGFAGLAIAYFNMPPAEFNDGAEEQRKKIAQSILSVDGRETLLNSMLAGMYDEVIANNPAFSETQDPDPDSVHTPPLNRSSNNAN
ncbi:MAG: serine/threonine-protein kinase [Planctomycetota bacterium]